MVGGRGVSLFKDWSYVFAKSKEANLPFGIGVVGLIQKLGYCLNVDWGGVASFLGGRAMELFYAMENNKF
ncbi:hypothetical protein AMTR_s00055p00183480 [Amborella trichopoda]|uniref:Uncharacterized protein n=1 Tax=Amborella trichopoda TaxID=13333 RepID=U5D772_AMBTC|nr:hypothetical protein AMTR_s00055p00183480 [Amborella trichopoda]